MKIKFILVLFLWCISWANCFCAPITVDPIISVGISDNSFQRYYYSENTFYSQEKIFIKEKNKNIILKEFNPETLVKVEIKNNLFNIYADNVLVLQKIPPPITLSTEKDGLIGIYNLKRAGKPALYRGYFELVKPKCKENMFLTNNILNLETYLLGVVPNEMPVRFGLEALKVQAIAARNYALRPREKKYHEFDICDSVACQVYFGAGSEAPLATQAVKETRGVVGLNNDELIIALYSSTAGGYTESYENAFLPKEAVKYSYLKAIADNPKIKSLEKEDDAISFYKSEPETFDNNSPYFRWVKEWTKEELEAVLKEELITAFKSGYVFPELKSSDEFGSLKEIKVRKRGKSGKVISMDIVTDKRTYTVEKELVIRRLFKCKGKALPSANVVFEHEYNGDKLLKIKAFGGGYGHGVGMSQHGAGFMSSQGFLFNEIFQHYYTDTAIALLPISLSGAYDKNIGFYDFYLTKKQAKIVVENKHNYSELKVVINGKEFKLKVQPSVSRKYTIDISKYVNVGNNKVYFFYSLNNNKDDLVKIYIELYGTQND